MKAKIPLILGTLSRAWFFPFAWFLSVALASIASAQSYPVDANGWSIMVPPLY